MALEEIMQKFGGTWKEVEEENLQEYYKLMDVNILVRKVWKEIRPQEETTIDGEYIVVKGKIGPVSSQTKFKLNEEYEEDRVGIKLKSVCRYEDGKIICESTAIDKPEIKPQKVTKEIISDDQMLVTIIVGDNDLVVKRYLKKQ